MTLLYNPQLGRKYCTEILSTSPSDTVEVGAKKVCSCALVKFVFLYDPIRRSTGFYLVQKKV